MLWLILQKDVQRVFELEEIIVLQDLEQLIAEFIDLCELLRELLPFLLSLYIGVLCFIYLFGWTIENAGHYSLNFNF
jgi:hypothetical protein